MTALTVREDFSMTYKDGWCHPKMGNSLWSNWPTDKNKEKPPKYGRCPDCKKRFRLKTYINHNGDKSKHIPPHK